MKGEFHAVVAALFLVSLILPGQDAIADAYRLGQVRNSLLESPNGSSGYSTFATADPSRGGFDVRCSDVDFNHG
jgi:hypothetical protein